MKKNRTKIKLESKISGRQRESSEESHIYRLDQVEKKISCLENKIEELEHSVKENIKEKVI